MTEALFIKRGYAEVEVGLGVSAKAFIDSVDSNTRSDTPSVGPFVREKIYQILGVLLQVSL